MLKWSSQWNVTLTSAQKARSMNWARRLKRVFQIDMEKCPECGGKVKIIASIEDPRAITKILYHLGLDTHPPQPKPARGPPREGIVEQGPDDFEVQQFPEYE